MFPFQQNSIIIEGKKSTYKTIMKIGKGSEGLVYQAIDLQSNNKVAVKMLNYIFQNEESALKLLQEKGPFKNVINILDMNENTKSQKRFIIVMELADGCFYQYWTQNKQKYDETGKLKLLYQIAYGVYEIHSINLIHRDLKLENIVVQKQENNSEIVLRICDTGLNKENKSEIKKTMNVGSPLFMAPEMLNSDLYNEKVDIWSLGMIFFEMISNQLLFSDNISLSELQKQLQSISQNQIDTQIDKLPNSDFVKAILKSLLVVDPNKRISSNELVYQLEKHLQLEPTEERENKFDKQLQDYKKELQLQMSLEIKQKSQDKQEQSEQILKNFKDEIQKQQQEIIQQQIKELEISQEQKRQEEMKLIEQNFLEKQESIRNHFQVQEQKNSELLEQLQIEKQNQMLRLEEQHKKQILDIESKFQQQFQQKMEALKKQQELQLQQQIKESYQIIFEEQIRQKEKVMDYQLRNKNELSRSRFLIEHYIVSLKENQKYSLNQEQIAFLEQQKLLLESLQKKIQDSLQLLEQIESNEQIDQFDKKKENELKNIQPEQLESLITQLSNQFFDQKIQAEQQLEKQKQIILSEQLSLCFQEMKEENSQQELIQEQDQRKFVARDQLLHLIKQMNSTQFLSEDIKNFLNIQSNKLVDNGQFQQLQLQQIEQQKKQLSNLNLELKTLDQIIIFRQFESSQIKEKFEKCVRHIFQSHDEQSLDFFQSNFQNQIKAIQVSKQNQFLQLLDGLEQQLSKQILQQKFFYISLENQTIELSNNPCIIQKLNQNMVEIMKQLEKTQKDLQNQKNQWEEQLNKQLKCDYPEFKKLQLDLRAEINEAIRIVTVKIGIIENQTKKLNGKGQVCNNQQELCKMFNKFEQLHSKIKKLIDEIRQMQQLNIFNISNSQVLQIIQFLEENEANINNSGNEYKIYQNEVRRQIQNLNNLILLNQIIEIENLLQLLNNKHQNKSRTYSALLKGFQSVRDSVLVKQENDHQLILVLVNKEEFSQTMQKMEQWFKELSKNQIKLEGKSFEDPQYYLNFLFQVHNYLQIQIKTINKLAINKAIKQGEEHRKRMSQLNQYANRYEQFQSFLAFK